MEIDFQRTNPAPNPTFPRKKNPLGRIFLVITAIILVAIGVFLAVSREAPKGQNKKEEKASSTSAKITSNSCPKGKEYVNEKQGYRVCFPESWKYSELQVSALTTGFDPNGPTDSFPGTLEVIINDKAVDVTLEETINNSSKYEFGKAFVDKVAGSQIIYTRGKDDPLATHPLAIDTLVSTFGRTYTVRLNTNEETRTADEKLYGEFLESWEFLEDTPSPPWSTSPNILVYWRWVDDQVKNPLSLVGEAIAFEGTVNVRIKDKDSHILLETTIQTQSGNQRSPFAADLSFDKPSTEEGILEVFTLSASDGSEQDKVTIPVHFP